MDITPQIAPFWFTPDDQRGEGKIRFYLKPLTQPQIVELYGTFKEQTPTSQTWYRAGEMGLNGGREIEGLTIDGRRARWPQDKDVIPNTLVIACGVELCMQAWSVDGGEAEKN